MTETSKQKKYTKRAITIVVTIVIALAVIFDFPPGIADIIFGESYLPDDFGKTEALDVIFIDVGQGDSALVGCMDSYILIDAGQNDQGNKILRILDKLHINKLDAIILTHPHSDHIGGADKVINNINVDKIYMSYAVSDTNTFNDVLDAIDNKGLTVTVPEVFDELILEGMEVVFLHPDNGMIFEETNDYSIACIIKNEYGSILFTGDIEEEAEVEILKTNYLLDVDILKVAHHGSKSSTKKDFLKSANPQYAVISCGDKNEYGHPDDSTLEKLSDMDVVTFITFQSGSIVFSMDSIGIEVITENATD